MTPSLPTKASPCRRWLLMSALLAVGSLCGSRAYSQTAPTEKTESLRGTVINSVTREPIPRALVFSPDNRFATMTDNEGRFEFTVEQADTGQGASSDTAPNRPNVLQARKTGYLTDPNSPPLNLSGPISKDVTISLMPEALLIGRVILPTSEPSQDIQLELYLRQVREGRAHWAVARSATTRSNGEFRFAELLPGTYKLITREHMDFDPLTFDPRGPRHGYPPVYYSGAAGFTAASEIRLSAGETVQATLTLARQPYYNVRIPVSNELSGPGFNVYVYLAGHRGPGYSLGYNNRNQAIEGLLPNGTYTVEATAFGTNNSLMTGSVELAVHGGAAAGPVMTLTPSARVAVTVKEEFTSDWTAPGGLSPGIRGGRRLEPTGAMRYLNVTLEPADDFGDRRGASLRPPTSPGDDSLVLDNVQPGRYWVRVFSARGFAASIRSGAIDLLHHPLTVGTGGAASPIEITMRDDSAEIDGNIEGVTSTTPNPLNGSNGAGGMVVPGLATDVPPAHVYCVPLPDSSGAFTEVWVSPDGSFQSPPLAPGAYLVLAFEHRQPELEFRNPEAMRAYDSKGPVVRVVGGQKEHVRLQLISPSE